MGQGSFFAAEFGGGHSHILLEFPAEAGGTDITHGYADIVYGQIRGQEELFCLFQAQVPYIIRKIFSCFVFEQVTHIGDTYIKGVGNAGDGKIRRGILLFN